MSAVDACCSPLFLARPTHAGIFTTTLFTAAAAATGSMAAAVAVEAALLCLFVATMGVLIAADDMPSGERRGRPGRAGTNWSAGAPQRRQAARVLHLVRRPVAPLTTLFFAVWRAVYWANPAQYSMSGLVVNEFTSSSWAQPVAPGTTVGEAALQIRCVLLPALPHSARSAGGLRALAAGLACAALHCIAARRDG